jgi:hypothetical protein
VLPAGYQTAYVYDDFAAKLSETRRVRLAHPRLTSRLVRILAPHEPLNYSVFVFAFASLYLGLSQDVE